MTKLQIQKGRWTFNKVAKTITFLDFSTIELSHILLITDVTAGIVLFQFNKASKNGTVSTNVLTLTFNTNIAGINNTDDLQIFYNNERDLRDTNRLVLTNAIGVTETTLIPAVSAQQNDIKFLMITNSGAGTQTVSFRDTTGGAVKFTTRLLTNTTLVVPLHDESVRQTTANTNWTAQLSAVPAGANTVEILVVSKRVY